MKNKVRHISFIMDGNNRWSKKKNLSLNITYKKGVKKLIDLSNHCFFNHGINYISAFALSSHNLSRSKILLNSIFKILEEFINEFLINNHKYNFNIIFIGNFTIFNKNIRYGINKINNSKIHKNNLIIALNYSGTEDIENASKLFNQNKNSKLKFHNFLRTSAFPNPDIIIRTGGFQRLSDFFLFQSSFTELFFSKSLWPDFSIKSIDSILKNFLNIKRKFGK